MASLDKFTIFFHNIHFKVSIIKNGQVSLFGELNELNFVFEFDGFVYFGNLTDFFVLVDVNFDTFLKN